jgi:hypothetical protein
MAGRILNRREMRKQSDQAEQSPAPDAGVVVAEPKKKKVRAKAPAGPKVRKVRAKKPPPRRCARWGVFDGAMKQVAIFDYNQRAAADQKVADLVAKKANALYFLQIVKEPMPEPEPEPAAAPVV